MNFNQLTIETTIKGDHLKIWEAWTLPKHITQWNFAIDEWCCPHAENDLRVGGTYKARMEAKDGSFGFDFGGTYKEVIPYSKIVLLLGDGRTTNTLFEKLVGQTKITTIFDAEKENPEEMQKNGWQSILNNFKKYCEQKLIHQK